MAVKPVIDKPVLVAAFNDNVSLIVGDQELSAQLQKVLSSTGITVSGLALSGSEDMVWNRDFQIVLLDSHILLPVILSPSWVLGSITGLIRQHFVGEQYLFAGNGLSIPSVFSGTDRAKKAQTCLEGGNVKFFGYDKQIGAVVGASSVIFSALHMETSHMFPSYIYEQLRTYSSSAYEMVFDFVLEKIAEDLGVNKINLLVMEHQELHIDLELLMGPDRNVFLHDPDQARLSIQYVKKKSTELLSSWEAIPNRVVLSELNKIEKYEKSQIYKRNKSKLERFGFNVIGVPGFNHTDERAIGGYFLNGILLQDSSDHKTFFLTTAATYGHEFTKKTFSHLFAERFSDVMKKNGIFVIYFNCGEVSGGGLHCMTTEIRKDGFTDSPHIIPMRSKDFPTHITTRLQVEFDFSETYNLITIDCFSKKETKWPVNLIPKKPRSLFSPRDYGRCFIDVPVPADGHLDFSLSTEEDDFCPPRCGTILPGHPQLIKKSSLL